MDQAYPSLTPELKLRLESQGLKPYKQRPISDFLNPHKPIYWATNGVLTLGALYFRQRATSAQSVRIIWSMVVVAVPFFALSSTAKLDGFQTYSGHRKTLDERLDFSPITRRAWERAQEENNKYQQELKDEIDTLEARLARRR